MACGTWGWDKSPCKNRPQHFLHAVGLRLYSQIHEQNSNSGSTGSKWFIGTSPLPHIPKVLLLVYHKGTNQKPHLNHPNTWSPVQQTPTHLQVSFGSQQLCAMTKWVFLIPNLRFSYHELPTPWHRLSQGGSMYLLSSWKQLCCAPFFFLFLFLFLFKGDHHPSLPTHRHNLNLLSSEHFHHKERRRSRCHES